ncbi:uncharacterized protein LOC141614270 [Silene latifolia]|uniref:uncharacterized protein LOC141614270 n=1 Tax=Silene latifolia TaxID=37657 RepID=UPI003D786BBB
MDLYPHAYAHFLPEGLFDHNPVEIVQHNWLPTIQGSLIYQVVTKLKKLKKPLKELNRNHFSDVDKAVGVAQAVLEDIQLQIQSTPNDHSLIEAEMAAADSLRHLFKVQHSFLSQKAKVEWLANGDDNTQFFHNQIRARQDWKTGYPAHHAILLAPITAAEVKDSMFSIASSKSPGPDGYSSQFFKDTLGPVGDDIIAAVKDFFTSEKLLRELNTTNLTLIPKMTNPTSVLDFRAIACCNTVYKCLSKVLCQRLSKILPEIINESQGGFIRGRNIVENVLIC